MNINKSLWTDPVDEEELICEREVGNPCDPQAVAMKKEIRHVLQVVGHVPRRISLICSIFIRRGGFIKCTVTGHQRYSSDLPQGGLEVPCKLNFITKIFKEGSKTKKLIESTLSVEVGEIEAETPVIACSDGTPTGKEQDARPEPSVLIDLTNSEDDEMQAPAKKGPGILTWKELS